MDKKQKIKLEQEKLKKKETPNKISQKERRKLKKQQEDKE